MRGHLMRGLKYEWKNHLFSYYSKLNWGITTKFLPVINLIRLQLFTKFEVFGCTQNRLPAKTILNFPRAWQAHFLSHNIHNLWKVIFSKDILLIKVWLRYLKWRQICKNCSELRTPFWRISMVNVSTWVEMAYSEIFVTMLL